MDMQHLKNALEALEMPASMRERIKSNCLMKMEGDSMNRKNKQRSILKPSALIAAILLLCLPVIGMAVGNSGIFKDIKNLFGTVISTKYETSEEEILLTVFPTDEILTVCVTFLQPNLPPYSELDTLTIGSHQILDSTGNVLPEMSESYAGEVMEGQANLLLSIDTLEKGEYTLQINSLIGSKKADQPLSIHGCWKAVFIK